MEVFMQKEYFNSKLAIQREFFVEEKNDKLVIINGEKYDKSYSTNDDMECVLYFPKENLRTLPIIQIFISQHFITLETNKIVDGIFLEKKLYNLEFNESEKEINAVLTVQYFDISNEIDNKNYLEEYFIEKSIKKEFDKKIAKEYIIKARKNSQKIAYVVSIDGKNLFEQLDENKLSLFELLNDLSKQLDEKNNLKK